MAMPGCAATTAEDQSAADALHEKELGNSCYKARQLPQAIEHYTNAIQLDCKAVYFSNRAAAYFENRQFEECSADCDQAIKLLAANGEAEDGSGLVAKVYARKGNARVKQGRHVAAVECFRESLIRKPDQPAVAAKLNESRQYAARMLRNDTTSTRAAVVGGDPDGDNDDDVTGIAGDGVQHQYRYRAPEAEEFAPGDEDYREILRKLSVLDLLDTDKELKALFLMDEVKDAVLVIMKDPSQKHHYERNPLVMHFFEKLIKVYGSFADVQRAFVRECRNPGPKYKEQFARKLRAAGWCFYAKGDCKYCRQQLEDFGYGAKHLDVVDCLKDAERAKKDGVKVVPFWKNALTKKTVRGYRPLPTLSDEVGIPFVN